MIVTRVLLELADYAALLFWGLHMVQMGMLRDFGGRLRQVLRLAMGDRIRAFASGLAVTSSRKAAPRPP